MYQLLDHALIAKYKKDNKRFEIFVDKDKAYLYHIGEYKKIEDVLVVDEIFKDARKGERWDEKTLMEVFGTIDPYTIADQILKHGDVPMTAEQRKKKIEERKRQILEIIRRETIDPRTNAPHTMIRLENAFEQAKVHIDPFKSADQQVEDVIKALRPILPMKVENVEIAIRVPAAYASKAYGTLKEYNPKKEEWTTQGDLIVVIEIPAGMQTELYSRINSVTHGNVQTRILSRKER